MQILQEFLHIHVSPCFVNIVNRCDTIDQQLTYTEIFFLFPCILFFLRSPVHGVAYVSICSNIISRLRHRKRLLGCIFRIYVF